MALVQNQAIGSVPWRWVGGRGAAHRTRQPARTGRRRAMAGQAGILTLQAAALAGALAFATAIRVEGLERFSPVARPAVAVERPEAAPPALHPRDVQTRARLASGISVATLTATATPGPLLPPDPPVRP